MGGGGGGKGGGAPSQITTQPDPNLSAFVKEFADTSRPVRNTIFSQIEEALTTGGVGARIPIAQRGVEATQSATSMAATNTQSALAAAGLGRTPFGQGILAQQQLQGQTQAANIYPNIAAQLAGTAPNLALGSAQSIISGFGTAGNIGVGQGQLGVSSQNNQNNNITQLLTSLVSAAGVIGAAAV